MIPVSIQIKQALDRLWLPVMLLFSLAIMLLGWANPRLTTTARMATADILSPLWSLIAVPGNEVSGAVSELRRIGHLAQENARLRTENETLRGWYDVAVSLTQENVSLKENLHWIPDPLPSFVTGRVIADVGGIYAHAVLINAGPSSGVHVGDVALAVDGFVGRVTETGLHSARILLINDTASHIPVLLEASHGTAIMTGDNTSMPRLMFYAQDNHPVEGERVVTSGQADLLPGSLPVGMVHYIRANTPVVVPYARLDHLNLLRVFNFDTGTIESPDAPGRVPVSSTQKHGVVGRKGNPMDGMTLGGVIDGGSDHPDDSSDTARHPASASPEDTQHEGTPRSAAPVDEHETESPKEPERSGSATLPSSLSRAMSGRG